MPRPNHGFTLLELLVVMALIGLLTTLAAPRLWTWIESARTRAAREAVHTALLDLPAQTFFSGQPRVIAETADLGLDLPPDWRIELPAPLRYEPNGMTEGGRVVLRFGDRPQAAWDILAPAGTLRDTDAP